MKESLSTVTQVFSHSNWSHLSFKIEQLSSKFIHLDVLKQQIWMINKLMSSMQETLTILLHHFKSWLQQFINSSKSSEFYSAKQSIKSDSHYSHFSVFTLTSAKWLPFKPDMKHSVSESEMKQFDRENEYNDYDTKSMNKNCVDA